LCHESDDAVTTHFTRPTPNTEVEDKGRLSPAHAARVARRLDAGLLLEVPDWGRFSIRILGVSRIIDRYYDTADRALQTWSKAHGQQLLLRERREGSVISGVDSWATLTQAAILRLPVDGETHTWVAKVPYKRVNAPGRFRKAREHEAPFIDGDSEAVRVELLGLIGQTLGHELDSTSVEVRECVFKVRKSYGVFAQASSRTSGRRVATIDLDFIVREYYRTRGISVERYAKYEAEKRGRTTARQFAACTQVLRAVLYIPKDEPPPLLTPSPQ
jgi:hypothetical protein